MTQVSARGRKQPPLAAPVSDIAVTPQIDGTDLHSFTVNGVIVHVRAVRLDRLAAAETLIAKLHALCSIPAAAPRTTEWGDGQFDDIEIGPGVSIALRVTKDGRVLLYAPSGPLDVTAASASLGTGLHEAGRRAAQIRVHREERARRREAGLSGKRRAT